MSYEIVLVPAAARQLRKLDPPVRRRMQAVFETLAENPRPPAATLLVGGAGEWRVRSGDYRIVYEIHDGKLRVLVLRVGHRRDILEPQAVPVDGGVKLIPRSAAALVRRLSRVQSCAPGVSRPAASRCAST